MVLSCKDITKSYGVETILEKVSFAIEDSEKVAVVGVNGAGKTTLFKILLGIESADSGDVFFKKDISIGYLEQNIELEDDKTIYDEVLEVFKDIISLEDELREMERHMANVPRDNLSAFMKKYSDRAHCFEMMDGYSYKSRLKGVLKGLGFSDEELQRKVETLSGGERTRVLLSKLLLNNYELLLLDEPTNHLDIDAIQWLELFLKDYKGAVIIISHDRYFMDKIVEKVIDVENKRVNVYNGNYTEFVAQKDVNKTLKQKQYLDQQKEIKRQEEVIKTLRSFNREKSIKRAESREKSLEKMDKMERPLSDPKKIHFSLTPKVTSGRDVVYFDNISKSFEGTGLFKNVNFDIKRGEKVAIIGPNGVGKSTLFRILQADILPDTGTIKFGTNVNVGYYDQQQQNLDESKTVFQEISDTYPSMKNEEIRNVLAAFVFVGDDVFKPISALSGGEKGRVALAKIMLSKCNLLLLDEPTNHLDMFSKKVLEDAINRYEGTVVYISHDRYFINKTAEKILELTKSGIRLYIGDYTYYLEKSSENKPDSIIPKGSDVAENTSPTKNDWQKKKEEQARQRKTQNRLKKIEEDIEKLDEELIRLNELLNSDKISFDAGRANDVYKEKTDAEQKLNELFVEWEELSK